MIQTNALTFAYSSSHPVLSDITLSLGEGHIHGLLGCNGIGKTTLLKILCGIMRPDRGRVSVFGYDPAERRKEMFEQMIIIPEEFALPNISLMR